MFDRNSDYALNKRDKDTIAYISVTGVVYLTCADFPNEAEFLKRRCWSDGDYRATEKAGRAAGTIASGGEQTSYPSDQRGPAPSDGILGRDDSAGDNETFS